MSILSKIFGDPNDAQKVAQKRNEIKDILIIAIDTINLEISEFEKAIDDLIVLDVNLLKKRYIDSDSFLGAIDKIK